MSKPAKLALGIAAFAAIFAEAARRAAFSSPVRLLFAWVALSCAIAGFAYAANRPDLFGKRAGRLDRLRVALLLPYLLAFRLACWIMRTWRRTPALSRVTPELWVGGRIDADDLPCDDPVVLDLVCEFDEPEAIRSLPGYRCVPVLDGHHPPDEEAFVALLDELAEVPGPVVVHCESGRGARRRRPPSCCCAAGSCARPPTRSRSSHAVVPGRSSPRPTAPSSSGSPAGCASPVVPAGTDRDSPVGPAHRGCGEASGASGQADDLVGLQREPPMRMAQAILGREAHVRVAVRAVERLEEEGVEVEARDALRGDSRRVDELHLLAASHREFRAGLRLR